MSACHVSPDVLSIRLHVDPELPETVVKSTRTEQKGSIPEATLQTQVAHCQPAPQRRCLQLRAVRGKETL